MGAPRSQTHAPTLRSILSLLTGSAILLVVPAATVLAGRVDVVRPAVSVPVAVAVDSMPTTLAIVVHSNMALPVTVVVGSLVLQVIGSVAVVSRVG